MSKTPRFPKLTLETLHDDQKPVAEAILKFSLNGLGGPFNMLLRSPDVTRCILTLGDYMRFRSAVPDRLAELAVLIHARIWADQYEWALHAGRALKAGVSEATLEALCSGCRPAAMAEDERAVFDFCTAVVERRALSDDVFARAKAALGEKGVVDLTIALGQYTMISMILWVSEAELPEGMVAALPPIEAPFGK
jgi:4-carboxymuconolactone decarboxylase